MKVLIWRVAWFILVILNEVLLIGYLAHCFHVMAAVKSDRIVILLPYSSWRSKSLDILPAKLDSLCLRWGRREIHRSFQICRV